MNVTRYINTRHTRIVLLLVLIVIFVITLFYNLSTLPNVMKVQGKLPSYKLEPGEIVTVTAYFNLGSFAKGSRTQMFTSNTYNKWMKKYSNIYSPVIAYFDDKIFADKFKEVRSNIPEYLTKIFIIDRSTLWGFKMEPRIKKIYDQPSYPKHLPNTVIPNYSCAMHAKYDAVEMAMKANYYNAEYYAWIDLGYWRNLPDNVKPYKLMIPNDFDRSKIAFNEVYVGQKKDIEMKNIFYQNIVWVGGGAFLGDVNNLQNFIDYYRHAVDVLLNMGLMDTDQQVIYAMHNEKWPEKLPFQLQLYKPVTSISPDPWFYLGFLFRKTWMVKHPDGIKS